LKQDTLPALPPANENDRPYEWKQLSSHTWSDLLVGNGASIAVCDNFDYSSLRKFAGKKIGPTTSKLFTQLDNTDDFERVLLACWHAELVNKALGTPSSQIRRVYEISDEL
jgi:hypothetical protein